jgi:hypothetical protein
VRKGLGFNFSFFTEFVHVDSEPKLFSPISFEMQHETTRALQGISQVVHGLDIGGQAGQANKGSVGHFEYFLEVRAECQGLDAKSTVGGNGDTVLALHGNNRCSIVLGNGLFWDIYWT